MKKFLFLSCICFIVVSLFTTCKKQKAFKTEDGQDATDVCFIQTENDFVLKEINEVLSKQAIFLGYAESYGNKDTINICGLSLDTSLINKGVLTLNYNNSICSNRQRNGSITLSIQNYPYTKLKDQNCILKVEFKGYKVNRKSENKSLILDGIEYVENMIGGTWYELVYLNLPNLVQNVTGQGLRVQYNNSSVSASEYNISRQYLYTFYTKKIITCVVKGTGSDGSKSNLGCWGSTRQGINYTAEMAASLVWNSNCGPLTPGQGEVIIKTDKKAFSLDCVYGTDGNGNASGNACPYGWKMTWKYKNKTKTRVFAY